MCIAKLQHLRGVCNECQTTHALQRIGKHLELVPHHSIAVNGGCCEDMLDCEHHNRCKGTYTAPCVILPRGS